MEFLIPYRLLTEEQKTLIQDFDDNCEDTEREYPILTEDLTDEQFEYLVAYNKAFICDDCGELRPASEAHMIRDANDNITDVICTNCFYSGDYTTCYASDHIARTEIMWRVNPNTNEEAYYHPVHHPNNLWFCTWCGEMFDEGHSEHDNYGNAACTSCAEAHEIIRCDDCGLLIPELDIYRCDDGASVCESCYNRHDVDDDDEYECDDDYDEYDSIDDYGHNMEQSEQRFRNCENEDTKEYFGVELEMESRKCNPENVAYDIRRAMPFNVTIKHDGSLSNGFEFVSDPCTLQYHMTEYPWTKITDIAQKKGMRSHDTTTCGLHIHVSRNSLGDTEDEQDMVIAKLLILFERFQSKIEKFARRTSGHYYKYKALTCNVLKYNEVKRELYSDRFNNKCNYHTDARYCCVNITNRHTVEFRIFKGTLRRDTIIASLQFVHEMIDYCKNHGLIDIQNCVWTDICHNTEYAELKEYLKIRELYW